MIEEFARHGVETIFLKAPQTPTAEDQLLVQFQGMIAEAWFRICRFRVMRACGNRRPLRVRFLV